MKKWLCLLLKKVLWKVLNKKSTLPIWIRILPAVFISLLMFGFSSLPGSDAKDIAPITIPQIGTPFLNLFAKKGAHFLVYFALGQSYFFAFENRSYRNRLLAVVFAVLFSISDEIHQSWTLARTPSAIDILIDGFGIWVGLFPFHTIFKIRKVKQIS